MINNARRAFFMVFHPVIATRDHKRSLLRQQGRHRDALLVPWRDGFEISIREREKWTQPQLLASNGRDSKHLWRTRHGAKNNLARDRAAPPPSRHRQA